MYPISDPYIAHRIASQQIAGRVRDAEARRIARTLRHQAPTTPGTVRPRPVKWVWPLQWRRTFV